MDLFEETIALVKQQSMLRRACLAFGRLAAQVRPPEVSGTSGSGAAS